MQGTYWLTVLPETSKLVPGIRRDLRPLERGVTITPQFDTKGARRAGTEAGREVQAGMESSTRGGGIGRLLRIDGARSAGQQAGREVNAGLASADIGRDASSRLSANLLSGAESTGRRLGSILGTGLKATAAVGGTLAVAGIAGAMKAGFSRLTAIDDARFKLQGLGNDAGKVQNIMDNALESVKGTAFGLDEAATTAASAVAAGIAPGEQLTAYLKLTADTAAIAGTSLADMGSIFNKVQTSGKAFTGDLNMLSDRGLPVFQWLQEEYGVTGEEFSKMVADGKVDAATFQKVIAENIGGAAQTMGGSVRGSLSNLKASFSRFGAELAGPVFAGLQPLAIGLTGMFDGVTKSIKPIMADLSAKLGPWAEKVAGDIKAWADNGGIEKIVAWFGRLRDTIAGLSTGAGRSEALSSITDSVSRLGPALAQAGPLLGTVATTMKDFGAAVASIGGATIASLLEPALTVLGGTLRFVADNASWAVPTIAALAVTFTTLGNLTPILMAFVSVVKLVTLPAMLMQTAAIRAQTAAFQQLSAAIGVNDAAQVTNAGATAANTGAQSANAAAQSRGRIATLASAAASKVAAAAQWLWNAAVTANPIGIVIVAVAAAAAALWAFFTKTETGRKLWDKIWTGIKTTAITAWNWIKDTFIQAWAAIQPTLVKLGTAAREAFSAVGDAIGKLWNFIQPAIAAIGRLWLSFQKFQWSAILAGFRVVGDVISWLWTSVVVPAFQGIGSAIDTFVAGSKTVWAFIQPGIKTTGDVIMWLWHSVAVPAFTAIGAVISTWWSGVKFVWNLLSAAIRVVGNTISWLWKNIAVPAFTALGAVISTWWSGVKLVWAAASAAVRVVGDVISWLWQTVAVPAFQAIGSVISTWWSGVQVVWDAFTAAVGWVGDKINWLWQNVATPAFDAIGGAASSFWETVRPIWDLFMTAVDKVGAKLTVLKDGFMTAFNAIKDVVLNVWNSIGSVFDKITSGIKAVGDFFDSGSAALNQVARDPAAPAFASGGTVRGPGTGTSDSVLAWLSNGEGVVKTAAMDAGGSHIVAALNAGWVPSPEFLRGMMIPGYAQGLNAGADYLRTTIMQQWPSITNIGGRRSEDGYGEHSSGNAIDVMIPGYNTPQGKALGDTVASFIAKNRDVIGADGMIWRQTSFGYGGSWDTGKPMGDRGSDTQNHMDHLHIILGKGRGAGAPSVDAPASALSLPSGGTTGGAATLMGAATSASAGGYKTATDKQLTASADRVDAANTAVKNAEQAVDDRTQAVDKAQRRLDELQAAGKDTTDAQYSLDKANRELTDANEALAKKREKASRAQNDDNELRTKGVADASPGSSDGGSGNPFSDLGKALAGGIFETLGVDGSVFSNPFEWPTVKSIMAGINVLGSTLSGGGTGGESSSGSAGGMFGGLADAVGVGDMLTNLNPGADMAAAYTGGNVAPDTTTHGTGNGANPGPAVVIEQAGMSPTDVANTLSAEFNNRTRTTKVH